VCAFPSAHRRSCSSTSSRFATWSSNSVSLNGLARKSRAPRDSAARLASSVASAVSTKNGVAQRSSNEDVSRSMTSRPSILGICKSSRTSAGRSSTNIRIARGRSVVVTTREYPARCSNRRNSNRFVSSSSITRIRSADPSSPPSSRRSSRPRPARAPHITTTPRQADRDSNSEDTKDTCSQKRCWGDKNSCCE